MRENIEKEVKRLIYKYKTRNPFDIAENENIIILYESLGSINGYYNKYARQKFIHINSEISEEMQLVTCAHELGHARLHQNANTPFFRANTFFSISKLEKQANLFAAELLISDININEIHHYSLQQLSSYFNVPIELVKIKFNID